MSRIELNVSKIYHLPFYNRQVSFLYSKLYSSPSVDEEKYVVLV